MSNITLNIDAVSSVYVYKCVCYVPRNISFDNCRKFWKSERKKMRQNISGLCEHRKKLQGIGMKLLGIWMIQIVRRISFTLYILYCILDGHFYVQETLFLLEICRLFCWVEKDFVIGDHEHFWDNKLCPKFQKSAPRKMERSLEIILLECGYIWFIGNNWKMTLLNKILHLLTERYYVLWKME